MRVLLKPRLFFLRRLKTLGASQETLGEVYILFIRSILEFCAPLWTGALYKKDTKLLEHVQKSACKIILPDKDYTSAKNFLKLENWLSRHLSLTLKFAKQMSIILNTHTTFLLKQEVTHTIVISSLNH